MCGIAGLVLAEMTHAVGIGFDWLYHYLTPLQRQTIVAGVTRLGFGEALAQYTKHVFWANCTFNWVRQTFDLASYRALASSCRCMGPMH